MIFCDTSTLAKFYVQEAETAAVQKFLEGRPVALSEFAKTELVSVFHRRHREGKWTEELYRSAVDQFAQDDALGIWMWLPVSSEAIEATVATYRTLSPRNYLRAADCLHLATASYHGFVEIYTHDVHQSSAAASMGLKAVAIGA